MILDGVEILHASRQALRGLRGRSVGFVGQAPHSAFDPLFPVDAQLREAWLAWQLERTYSKNELLALYLNQTYYGNFAFGIEAAAQVVVARGLVRLLLAQPVLQTQAAGVGRLIRLIQGAMEVQA